MALVNKGSTLVSNRDAFPPVLSSGYLAGAGDTVSVATVATAATDSIGSTYRFGFVPSGARIQDIQLLNDATTAGVWALGVYCNDQQTLNLGAGVAPYLPTWSSTVSYVPGNTVLYGSPYPLVYTCITATVTTPPPNGNWTTGHGAIAAAGSIPIPNANVIFNAGFSTAAANTTWKSVFSPSLGAVGFAAANASLRVWELLEMIQDPGYEFHLVATATTAPTAAGSITLQWSWVR